MKRDMTCVAAAAALSLLLVLVGAAPAREREEWDERPGHIVADPDDDREVLEMDPIEMRRLAARPDRAPLGPVHTQDHLLPGMVQWLSIGPRPITDEYWSGNAPAAGRVSSIVVDPTNASVVYIAAAQGGVWKTTDGGATWTSIADGLSSLSSGALCIDRARPDTVFYGTGEQHGSVDCYPGDGLFMTTDGGSTWSKIGAKASVGSFISRVAFNSGLLLVASDLGVARSFGDYGATWTVTLAGSCTDLLCDPTDINIAYAAISGSGVYKSVNAGATWTKLAGGLPAAGFARINMAIAASSPATVYASFVNGSGGLLGMYKTTNGGTTWSLLGATPNYLGSQGWYDNAVAVDPTNPSVVWACGNFPYSAGAYGLILSTNGGTSWADVNRGVDGSTVHPDQHFGTYGPDGTFWVACDGGVWKSTDRGAHWTNCNSTLAITQFYTLSLHPTNGSFILGGTQDNGTVQYDGTLGWTTLATGDGGPCPIEWDSPNIFYSTYVRLSYMDKYDAGQWQDDVTGPWSGDRISWCNAPFLPDPNTPNSLVAGTHRVWRTTNSGVSWSTLSGDLTGGGSAYLLALAVAPGASNTIYSGSSDGRIYATTDAVTWNLRNAGIPVAKVTDLVVSPTSAQTVYCSVDVSTGSRVLYTTDAGVTWTALSNALPSGLRGLCLAADFRFTPPRLFLGTDLGVYASWDNGASWSIAGGGMPAVPVNDIAIDPANNVLVAATHGRGMWRAPLTSAPPVVNAMLDQSVDEGATLIVQGSGSDPEGEPLIWGCVNVPPNATFDNVTGTLTFSPDHTQAGVLPLVTMYAIDPWNMADSASFTITVVDVNAAPTVNPLFNRYTAYEGLQLVVPLQAVDVDGDSIHWSLTSIVPTPPTGYLPPVVDGPGGSGSITWTPPYPDEAYFDVALQADDLHGHLVSTSTQIQVRHRHGAPFLLPRPDTTVAEGAVSRITLHASKDHTTSLTTWALLQPAPPWATLLQTTGDTVTLEVRPGFSSADSLGSAGLGRDSIRVQLTGTHNDSSIGAFVLIISNEGNATPVITAIPAQRVPLDAAWSLTPSASDADGDALTWSAENLPAGMTMASGTGALSWQPPLVGYYPNITLIVTDTHGATARSAFSITVTGASKKFVTFSAAPARFGIERAAPSPFVSAVEFVVGLPEAGAVEARVFDGTGRLVRRLGSRQVTAPGYVTWRWDGTADNGAPVAGGVYLLEAQTGTQHAIQRVVKTR